MIYLERNLTKDSKLISLTFDDGPNLTTTNDVLDRLEKYDIPASFFLIGDYINEKTAESVKRAVSLGCDIQNHSKTHSDMTKFTAEEIKAELEYTDRLIFDITGKHTEYFRPPYIYVNDVMFENIDLPFICGTASEDWIPDVSAEKRAENVLNSARDGAMVLLHDLEGNDKTVKALDIIIPALKERGFEFVTVSDIFGIKEVTPARGIVYSYTDQKK